VCSRYHNIYTDIISCFSDFSLSDFVFANVLKLWLTSYSVIQTSCLN